MRTKNTKIVKIILLIILSVPVSCAAEVVRTFHLNISELIEDFSLITLIVMPFCLLGLKYTFDYVKSRIKKVPPAENITPGKPFRVICVILFFIILSEFTLFNYHHYRTLFSDEQVHLNLSSPDNSIETHYDKANNQVIIKDVNMRVSSLYIGMDVIFKSSVYIEFSDEEGSNRTTPVFNIVQDFEKSRYVPLASHGIVTDIIIYYGGSYAVIENVTLNTPIPLEYHLLRIILIFAFVFGIWLIHYKDLTTVKVDFKSKLQNIIFVCLISAVFVLIWGTTLTSTFSLPLDQYSENLVDALMKGQTHLDLPTTQKMLDAEFPYDSNYRISSGLSIGEDYYLDHVYYKGRWYSYFGIVPVLVLFLPYKLIAGDFLPTCYAVAHFACLAACFLMWIWQELARKYMKNMPFVMYIIGAAVIALTPMTLQSVRQPWLYEAAVMAGVCFASAGFLCLIKAFDDKINYKYLTAASIFLALAVGCRPTMVLVSAFVPLFLIPRLGELFKDKVQFRKTALSIIPAYSIVAAGLMYYNYVRFGSVTDFGVSYMINETNIGKLHLLNPVSKIETVFQGIRMHFFAPLDFSVNFPFVKPNRERVSYPGYPHFRGIIGLINYPIMWFLALLPLLKREIKEKSSELWRFYLLMPAISVVMIMLSTYIGGFLTRYQLDYMWMLVLLALTSSYFLYEKLGKYPEIQTKTLCLICFMMLLSILVALFASLTGENISMIDISLWFYYYLWDIFGIWT